MLIIGPNPFIPQSSPDHSPQPRIDFSYYEISGPDICSLICGSGPDTFDDFDCRLFPGRHFELQIPSFVLSNSIGRSSVPIAIPKIGIAHRLTRAVWTRGRNRSKPFSFKKLWITSTLPDIQIPLRPCLQVHRLWSGLLDTIQSVLARKRAKKCTQTMETYLPASISL